MELQSYLNLMKKLPHMLTQISATLPSECLSCGCSTQAQKLICQNCVDDWLHSPEFLGWCDISLFQQAQKHMQIEDLDHVFCLAEHSTPIATLITQYKYQRNITARTALSQLFQISFHPKIFSMPNLADYDFLVPVPMHYSALWLRGFNQSLWLARQLSAHFEIPVLNALTKTQATKHQAKLSGEARRMHRQEVYAVDGKFVSKIQGRRVLLVDDVVTTGATLNSVAACLLEHEVMEVSAITTSWAKVT